jgi:hypothetical protein
MTKHSQALLDLATLISPHNGETKKVEEIMLSAETPWMEIIDFANQHLLIPALYSALKAKACFDLLEDSLIKEYLETVYFFNETRNKAILEQLQDVTDLLSEIEIAPVLLKGAAALSEAYYPRIGARVMSDIDILVPEEKIMESIALFESKGEYKPVDETHDLWDIHHYRKIYSDKGIATLELHFKSLAAAYPYFTNETLIEHIRPSKQIEGAMVIEPTLDLYHVFLHSEISDHAHEHQTLSLRQLHHAATIISAAGEEIDWGKLNNVITTHKLINVWRDYLYMLSALFDVDIPAEYLGKETHLNEILLHIDRSNSEPPLEVYSIVEYGKKVFSYTALQRQYNLKSHWEYPFALLRFLGSGFLKYTFSSEARKDFIHYLKERKERKKYGHHH